MTAHEWNSSVLTPAEQDWDLVNRKGWRKVHLHFSARAEIVSRGHRKPVLLRSDNKECLCSDHDTSTNPTHSCTPLSLCTLQVTDCQLLRFPGARGGESHRINFLVELG